MSSPTRHAISIPSLRRLASGDDGNSLSNQLRNARFRKFEKLVSNLPRPLRILDVGGENAFWEQRGWAGKADVQIVMLNLEPQEQVYENIEPIIGDATNLAQFDDQSFEIAFSNSVIEHLFTFENQKKMASEVQRVGKAFWVQTPNFWFPIEPHFHVPGWQWMPLSLRIFAIRRWQCGWRGPCPDVHEARRLVEELRLLTASELKEIFPGATLIPERIAGMTKSWTVTRGLQQIPTES